MRQVEVMYTHAICIRHENANVRTLSTVLGFVFKILNQTRVSRLAFLSKGELEIILSFKLHE